MRLLCVDSSTDKMDRHGVISHFRCATIPIHQIEIKHYLASQMRHNSGLRRQFRPAEVCGALTTGSAGTSPKNDIYRKPRCAQIAHRALQDTDLNELSAQSVMGATDNLCA
jgi:hypothetical protein